MQFHLGLPTDNVAKASEFVTADAIAEMSQAAEAAGFSSVFVTEHPYPEDEWMRSGGHHARASRRAAQGPAQGHHSLPD